MDFFENQDQARQRTRTLVVYFCIAVVLTMVAVYALCAAALYFATSEPPAGESFTFTRQSMSVQAVEPLWDNLPLDPQLMLLVFLSTGIIIALGSSVKTFQLSQGGRSVATMLGGQRLQPNSESLEEKQLLNIVEEMAIASGTPIPEVYLLKEELAINAFAAGFTPSDAVIGVTRGSMVMLNRDELQGVIAHEFSHILNGDMRMNMQMTCLTHGILFIAQTGMLLLRLPFRAAMYASLSSRSSKKGGLPIQLILAMLALGAALMLVGSIGFFFAQLIKSAVSRQREFLADASAVQFTRNPAGIGSALKKIGGLSTGSSIRASQAAEASHFFFANGLASSWFEWFSTHPPLKQRISIIDPHFDGTYPKVKALNPLPIEDDGSYRKEDTKIPGIFTEIPGTVQIAGMVASAGHLTPAAIQAAHTLTGSLPQPLYAAAHDPFGARAVAYGLLLSPEKPVQQDQWNLLQNQADPAVIQELKKLLPEFEAVPARHRLVLLDLTIPALRQLSPVQYQTFRSITTALAAADRGIDLFEYCLEKVLIRHLDSSFSPRPPTRPRLQSLLQVWPECMQLLAALAYLDSETEEEAVSSFHEGINQLNLHGQQAQLPPREQAGLVQVDAALNKCAQLTPMHKRNLLFACSQVILKFRGCSPEEAEIIRAIADTLDCPLPPIVIDQMAA
jgi:Zn-dependent protease with chaperone function